MEAQTKISSRSSLRIKYDAEVTLIKEKWGDLEDIRGLLGLSQRKMCQMLLVDPSAWTRWTKHDQKAPPHVYKSLSWILMLKEKYPEEPDKFFGFAPRELSKNQIRQAKEEVLFEVKKSLQKGGISEVNFTSFELDEGRAFPGEIDRQKEQKIVTYKKYTLSLAVLAALSIFGMLICLYLLFFG